MNNEFWENYAEKCRQTVLQVDHIAGIKCPTLAYRVLGLCGELAELSEYEGCHNLTNYKAELGDCLWYLVMIADTLWIDIETLEPGNDGIGVITAALRLGNVVKKIYRDNNGQLTVAVIEKIKEMLGCIFYGLGDIETLQAAANYNVEKLSKRLKAGKLHGDGDNR